MIGVDLLVVNLGRNTPSTLGALSLCGVLSRRTNGEIWIDPICVVIDGALGPLRDRTRILAGGAVVTPMPAVPPERSLPSPAP